MLSTVISSIPFLEHNDANRMLMASTMQRQSLPLVFKQFPFVRTTVEYKFVFSNSFLYFLQSSGNIRYVSMFKVIFSKEFSTFSWFLNGFKKNWFYYKDEYFYLNNEKSNQDTYIECSFFQLKNIWVNSNSLLSDNPSTYLGRLSFGRNFLIGYICWEGYNFEDAVVINEVLLVNDLLSSLYLKKYCFFLTVSNFGKVCFI